MLIKQIAIRFSKRIAQNESRNWKYSYENKWKARQLIRQMDERTQPYNSYIDSQPEMES